MCRKIGGCFSGSGMLGFSGFRCCGLFPGFGCCFLVLVVAGSFILMSLISVKSAVTSVVVGCDSFDVVLYPMSTFGCPGKYIGSGVFWVHLPIVFVPILMLDMSVIGAKCKL